MSKTCLSFVVNGVFFKKLFDDPLTERILNECFVCTCRSHLVIKDHTSPIYCHKTNNVFYLADMASSNWFNQS